MSYGFSPCEIHARYFSTHENSDHPSDAISLLGDLFSTLVGGDDSKAGRKRSRKELVVAFVASYRCLGPISVRHGPDNDSFGSKEAVLSKLASTSPDTDSIRSVLKNWKEATNGQRATLNQTHKLWLMCEPPYHRLFTSILGEDDGLSFLVHLREDFRLFMKALKHQESTLAEMIPILRQIDSDLKGLLSIRFAPHVLEIQRITYSATPAAVIEKIALKEAVHPLKSLNDLRNRLDEGRRCFALFHPLMRGEPLVFVHAALLDNIPQSMEEIDAGTADVGEREACPKVAAFYSITSAQPGLAGIDLGQHLLKSVMLELRREFPACIQTFVTLSPLPRFRKWIEGKLKREVDCRHESQTDCEPLLSDEEKCSLQIALKSSSTENVVEDLLQALSSDIWQSDPILSMTLEPVLLRLAARYLLAEKRHGKPIDGVAKFHIRNGALVHRFNFLADTSRRGMHQSYGVMVNYYYDLQKLEENAEAYAVEGSVAVSDEVGGAFGAGEHGERQT